MRAQVLTWKTVEVPRKHRDEIRSDIQKRNADRIKAELEPLDVERQIEIETAELADAMFEDRLRPYVERLYSEVEGAPGLAGRIKQHLEVYQRAEEILRDRHGLVRRVPVTFDLGMFMQRYQEGSLTDWGGCFSPIL